VKQIQAYIKPHLLGKVSLALQKIGGLRGMSVIEARGFGRRGKEHSIFPLVDDLIDFAKYAKIEIFCHDELVEEVVTTIDKNAYTGLRGDGQIYVGDVFKAFKIGKVRGE
jgi:nitrogen regulatory protein P-II 1